MAESKKSKSARPAPAPAPRGPALVESLWRTGFSIADDARAEAHKQVGAVIGLVEGALLSATRLASSINDRVNQLAIEGLAAADRAGRDLVDGTREGGRRLVSGTRESARGAAARASATAQALMGSSDEHPKAA